MHLRLRARDTLALLALGAAASAAAHVVQTPLAVDSASTSRKPTITPEFSAYVEKVLKDNGIPGVTIGIVHSPTGGKPEFELGAWGRKTEEGDGNDLGTENLFCLASVSKAFLASSLGILMDDFAAGRNVTALPDGVASLDWYTKVTDVLPGEWKMMDEWTTEKATLRDILAHVSGLPRHDYSYGPNDSPADMVHRLQYLRPAYELREQMSYNNIMYKVGAHIVAKYSNTSYEDFVSSRIFTPLNMSTTTYWLSEALPLLAGSWTSSGRYRPYWATDHEVELMAGPGGVISSVDDMVKWVATIMNKGVNPLDGETIVPEATWTKMTTSYTVVRGTSSATDPREAIQGYGMGWFRTAYRGHDLVWHTGAVPGFSTRVLLCPNDGLGMVILVNADEQAGPIQDISYHIIEKALGLPKSNVVFAEVQDSGEPLHEEPLAKDDLSLALENYTGTYFNPGYGAITFCAPASTSHLCSGVLSAFAPFEHFDAGEPSEPRLYAAFLRIWASHLRLVHHSGDDFRVMMTELFPQGFGKNASAFETWESGTSEGRAMFVVEARGEKSAVKGFGITIHEDVLEYRKQRGMAGVQELADAWFERV